MTRHPLYTVFGIISLLTASIGPCVAGPMGDTLASPYAQPLAAIGYNLDSPAAVADNVVSATDISDMFTAWRNAQRPAAGQVYAVVKQTPTGWMLSSLSPSQPGTSGLAEERMASTGTDNPKTGDQLISLAALPQD